nr:MAG TPA: hypothetical protein [Caudoviricetes sp.]
MKKKIIDCYIIKEYRKGSVPADLNLQLLDIEFSPENKVTDETNMHLNTENIRLYSNIFNLNGDYFDGLKAMIIDEHLASNKRVKYIENKFLKKNSGIVDFKLTLHLLADKEGVISYTKKNKNIIEKSGYLYLGKLTVNCKYLFTHANVTANA